ncbi:hypothetical protein SAMN04487820_109228 [Actinopolyspora mzabensis]|uniref:Uncharacterized protein n=1 Tax=Actinopolyspora mzabensis TaxID=995066 RepID=A0A1G9D366_ACTMZ|nr:hypothetical protein [Actinopolyspora mzabensis]SDK58368.1 hypothetical protein SAMN04487820_109228 [Actinopolyspora mzabensis]
MDPRNRADESLARARARGAFVVTPDSATSPMDAAQTVRIPRDSMRDVEREDPNSTQLLPDSTGQSSQREQRSNQQEQQNPRGEQPNQWEQRPRQGEQESARRSEPQRPEQHPPAEHSTAEQPSTEQRAWPTYDADVPTTPHRIDNAAYRHDPRHSPQRFD